MTMAVCGNGVEESGEGCDDGNEVEEDGCPSAAVDAMYEENIRVFGRVIMAGARSVMTADELPEEEADMLGLSLVGALAYAAMHWMQDGYRLSVEQMVKNAVRIIGGTALGIQQSRGN